MEPVKYIYSHKGNSLDTSYNSPPTVTTLTWSPLVLRVCRTPLARTWFSSEWPLSWLAWVSSPHQLFRPPTRQFVLTCCRFHLRPSSTCSERPVWASKETKQGNETTENKLISTVPRFYYTSKYRREYRVGLSQHNLSSTYGHITNLAYPGLFFVGSFQVLNCCFKCLLRLH